MCHTFIRIVQIEVYLSRTLFSPFILHGNCSIRIFFIYVYISFGDKTHIYISYCLQNLFLASTPYKTLWWYYVSLFIHYVSYTYNAPTRMFLPPPPYLFVILFLDFCSIFLFCGWYFLLKETVWRFSIVQKRKRKHWFIIYKWRSEGERRDDDIIL